MFILQEIMKEWYVSFCVVCSVLEPFDKNLGGFYDFINVFVTRLVHCVEIETNNMLNWEFEFCDLCEFVRLKRDF